MPAKQEALTLGPLQQQVIEHIWRKPGCSVREVVDALNAGGRDYAYTTIQTVCDALHRKRLVTRKLNAGAYVYRARETREGLLAQRLCDLLGRFGAEPRPVASSLVDALETGAPEQLEALIAELRERGKL